MYVSGSTQARSRNYFSCGISISVKYSVCVCVCSFIYPARKALAKCYAVICGLSGTVIFWFSLQTMPKFFPILRRIQQVIITNIQMSSCKVALILVRFEWILSFSIHFSKKISNTKFHENPSSGSQMEGQTDRYDKSDSHLRICTNVRKRRVV